MIERHVKLRTRFSQTKEGELDGAFLFFSGEPTVYTESIDVPEVAGMINLDFDAAGRLTRIEAYPWEVLGDNFLETVAE